MRNIIFTLCLLLAATLSVVTQADDSREHTKSEGQIRHWSFDKLPMGTIQGNVSISASDLTTPQFPDFGQTNSALAIKPESYLVLNESGGDEKGEFDFDNEDEITAEAWVNLESLAQQAYIIGKGRTGVSGKNTDQNWAFRIRRMNGEGCVNFLFRSKKSDSRPSAWHRWTSTSGFGVGDGWHHVAVSYKFGEPESIRGFVDGEEVKGKWDMGGPTKQPPVKTSSPVWIGSAMADSGGAGNRQNSFDGQMDELAIYRSIVPAEELKSRYEYQPAPVVRPPKSGDQVVNELFGPIGSISSIPNRSVGSPRMTWPTDALAFTRLPHNYDSWGVRDDWVNQTSKAMFVRSWMDLKLEPGEYQFMVRSRGYSRLFIDGKEILSTPKQTDRTGAHHVVDPLPEVPVKGMRPAFMSDHQRVADFHSDGGTHEIRYEVIVGGPEYRLEFGENCVAIARPGEMFRVASNTRAYCLDDAGWKQLTNQQTDSLAKLDTNNRRAQAAKQESYWAQRHTYAKQNLREDANSQSIDQIIQKRISEENEMRRGATPLATTDTFFREHVQPILKSNCGRCHGEKRKGDLAVFDRENLLRGGESGEAAVVPGKPDESYLIELVSADADERMPPKGDGLSEPQIETIRKWIALGAKIPGVRKEPITLTAKTEDHTFLRRVFIDTVGVPPTVAEAKAFLDDARVDRREQLIDRLLNDRRWADNWVGYWQDVLAENPNLLKPTLNNTGPFRYWIHEALTDNKPIDRFATELIQMRGSKWYGGAAGFSVASQNDSPMAAKAHVIGTAFMGVEMKCARCHDAPYHSWKQRDLFQLAAMLERKSIKVPATSTVPAAFFEKQERKSLIEVTLKPGETVHGQWPFASFAANVESEMLQEPNDPREKLAAQVTASRRFAVVIANRLWKRLMGAGIVEPVDDWEGNAPSDPKLLSRLADALIDSNYDFKALAKLILVSDAYQRTVYQRSPKNESDARYFAGPIRRRMTAEQIVDSAFHVVGTGMNTEQLTLDVEGTLPPDKFLNFGFPERAWEFSTLANERDRPSLAMPKVQAITDVLKAFGWRNSRPEPTSHREEEPNLVQPGALANGNLSVWLTRLSDQSGLTDLMCKQQDVESLVDELFLRMLTRKPAASEKKRFVELLSDGFDDRVSDSSLATTMSIPKRFRYVSWSNHLNSEANVIKVEMQKLNRKGPEPTSRLTPQWREKAEDAIWALINSPESVIVP